jgi:hypothetical protein
VNDGARYIKNILKAFQASVCIFIHAAQSTNPALEYLDIPKKYAGVF